ncbi:MAG: protein kinase [Anaerolineales bacterium]|nr:protein kinase [Anaerolineales bacterium]
MSAAEPVSGNACPKCGTPNRNSARFCANCGAPLLSGVSPASASARPSPSLDSQSPPIALLQSRYRIERELARGGFGAVYRAWDLNLNKLCAVKENLETSPEAQRQFAREATVLANLSHPNLPRVTDHFNIEGQGQYLVMDFVEGEDLDSLAWRLAERQETLPIEQALHWVSQVADALNYLHTRQPPVVHRDVKPANIRINPEGRAVLVDFGLVKFYNPNLKTTMGARAVTPGYAPPEQYGRGSTDSRSDIYALGATLYRLLSGQEPIESVQRIVGKQLAPLAQVNPNVPASISRAVERAMRLDPAQRFQTAEEFKRALSAPMAPPAKAAVPATVAAPAPVVHQPASVPRAPAPAVRAPSPVGPPLPAARQPVSSARPAPPVRVRPSFPVPGGISRSWIGVGAAVLLSVAVCCGLLVAVVSGNRSAPGSYTFMPLAGNTFQQGLLFTSNRDGKMEIYRLASDVGTERVTNSPGDSESWSALPEPGSASILFVSNRDGKREIYRLTNEGTERVTRTPGDGESWFPVPISGSEMLFVSNRSPDGGVGKREIYRLTSEGVEQVTLTPGDGESWFPVPEPGGGILFVSNRSPDGGAGKREIYRLTSEGVEQVTQTPGDGESWSPVPVSGNEILFVSDRDGRAEIYRLTSDGVERVTQTPGNAESWSPVPEGGGSFLFVSNRRSDGGVGKREIYRLTSQGVEIVTQSPGNSESWLLSE